MRIAVIAKKGGVGKTRSITVPLLPRPLLGTRKATPRYEKAHDAIKIIRAAKAAKITARLNLHIRRSYACTQPISPLFSGILPTAPISPLAFTSRF
jgi:hypothetical protein